jgi:hypothetical protein
MWHGLVSDAQICIQLTECKQTLHGRIIQTFKIIRRYAVIYIPHRTLLKVKILKWQGRSEI